MGTSSGVLSHPPTRAQRRGPGARARIRRNFHLRNDIERRASPESRAAIQLSDPVFLALWSTGPDPARDGVLFVEGLSCATGGPPQSPIAPTWMRPTVPAEGAAALARRSRELGAPSDLAELPPSDERLPDLLAPLAGRRVVVAHGGEELLARFRRAHPEAAEPTVLDLEGLAAFLHPHRGERGWPALVRRFLRVEPEPEPAARTVRNLCERLVAAHFEREPPLRQLFARGLDELASACDEEALASDWLAFARTLLDRPSLYGAGADPGLFQPPPPDGSLEEDLEDAPFEAERVLGEIEPLFSREYRHRFAETDSLTARLDEPAGLAADDLRILENFFDVLPKSFAEEKDQPPAPERPGQRALAHAVLASLAEGQFLLADAPTGTGKTLAYLAPMLLWSTAHGVRTAMSTYTRTLQEQAFFREVPRALALLRRAGLAEDRIPRVSMLKGRGNSICGRAIGDAAPETGTGSAAARVTWLRLALYFCEDPTADLDGFGLDPGIPLASRPRVLRRARAMVDSVRSLPRCCEGRLAFRCAAGIRSLRADRSHLVVTNHAFVLARPDQFHHLVFDECDHLHEVTVSARSFDIDLDAVAKQATELLQGRGRDQAPLERLTRLLNRLAEGDVSDDLREAAQGAVAGAGGLDAAAHELSRHLRSYREYRREVGDGLSPEEKAFLLHDYLDTGRGDELATSLHKLKEAVDQTDSGLRTCIEELGTVPQRTARRLCWTLRRPLDPLASWREALDLWLGGEERALGEVEGDFSHDFLYDAAFPNDARSRRRPLLTLKWLLPQQWLGETYFPSLRSAALVSATARVRNGFKAMKGYLGLDVLEADSLDRQGREVKEFAAPPTFDTRAALTVVPEDAPPFSAFGAGREDWQEYVEDVLLYLAERTSGRVLGLFTNRMVLQRVGERLRPAFAARGIPLYWQGMPGLSKEEITERFRNQVDSVLLGVDTFWYGVDFPGETCEYVVMTKLPYGVLDDYHFAQRARLGYGPHRNRIYLPKALAMFRQGCGRLLRNENDRGVVLVLDRRVLEKRNADFLRELPGGPEEFEEPNLLVGDTETCFQKAFAHMRLGAEIRRRGLEIDFAAARGHARMEDSG